METFKSNLKLYLPVALRIFIGWHFLYEGIVKLLIPDWTSAYYLENSKGIFTEVFRWMASNATILGIVDFLNIWGLILIGLGLFLGMYTRLSCIAGAFLLLLYYIANPPFIISNLNLPSEGHYLIINKNLIELCTLLLLAFFSGEMPFSFDRLLKMYRKQSQNTDEVTSEETMSVTGRREMIKNFMLLPFLGIFAYLTHKKYKWEKVHAVTGATIKYKQLRLKDLKGDLPKGKMGNLEVSRVILGNNLIGGWAHSRDLRYTGHLFKAYNTEKKIFETIELAEDAGINTFLPVTSQYPMINKYKKITGSKIQTICQTFPQPGNFKDIDKAIDAGATALYVQGGTSDILVHYGRLDVVGEAVEYIRSKGYLAGIGGHSIQTIMACEKANFKPDFYVKSIHHDRYKSAHPKEFRVEYEIIDHKLRKHGRNSYYDNMWDLFPEQTIEFMQTIKVPWIGYKVLAAGAILPKNGFKYAFENGADFICVGMFDFQIVEDVNIAIKVLGNLENRNRPWYA
jgi:uncharacterized membrane protein YphA (DoxX/SURF4 family)